ncbi:MAG: response regulator [Minisyncoccia bacterium]
MGGERKTIFLIEDDEILIKMYRLKLEKEGFKVKIATDGQEALLMLQKDKFLPDLILLDIIMPKMDGYTFLKEARKNNLLTSKTPIFILTNIMINNKERKIGQELGVIDFWLKSKYSPSEIVKKIIDALN